MAAQNRVITLNLGMQSLTMAEFRPSAAGGLILQAFRTTELLADPAADASRVAQLKIAVKETAEPLKAKGSKVNYAISSQSVFTRFVRLPPVEEDKIEQIVTFEAQQNVPFPISEVVWDHQLVSGGGEARIEVVLVAIKFDMLEELNGTVEEGGLRAGVVDIGPMTLFNAFRYNYSEMTGCSLLIDIGARTTNLIFIEPKKVFSRSIPIGGATVTGAVAKDFAEPFASAEERKKAGGFVGLGGAYAEHTDPDVARLAKIIRNTMTRLHAEIARSITFYRTQQQGAQPVRVFLAGGGSSMPYMREFFHEKLAMPVEYFNPMRNVAVAPELDPQEVGKHAHQLGEMVGLALRSVTDCPMELNLLPRSVVHARKLALQRPFFLLAAACVLLSMTAAWFYFFKTAQLKTEELDRIKPKIAVLKNFENKFAEARKEIKALQESAQPLVEAADDRPYWAQILNDLNERLPREFIWVTSFDPGTISSNGSFSSVFGDTTAAGAETPAATDGKRVPGIRLHGLYLVNPKGPNIVDEFFQKLGESPFLKNVKLSLRAQPTELEWAFDYEIRAELKNPISLK